MGFKDFGTLLGAALLLDWADFKDNNRLMALFSNPADTGFETLTLVFRSTFIRRLTVSEYKSISRVLGQSQKNSFIPITTIRYKKMTSQSSYQIFRCSRSTSAILFFVISKTSSLA